MQIVLKKPIISEKSMKLADKGQFTFIVAKDASKLLIAKVVKEKFNVDVISVRTFIVKGETKRQRRTNKQTKTTSFKKAVVQVKKGQMIGLFVPEKEDKSKTVTETQGSEVKEKKSLLKGTKVKIEKEKK